MEVPARCVVGVDGDALQVAVFGISLEHAGAVDDRAALSVAQEEARAHAIALAKEIARFPQNCLRADRLSALRQWDLEEEHAIESEMMK